MSAVYASRFEAIFLCLHEKGPKLTQTAAAKYMGKSKQFVSKWINRYKKVGNVDYFPDRGSASKVSKKDEKKILALFSKDPTLTLREAAVKLKAKGVDISYGTIRRHLLANKLKYRSTLEKPMLSAKHVEKRVEWAKENLDRDWSNVIFSDESSFWAFPSIKHAWTTSTSRMDNLDQLSRQIRKIWRSFPVEYAEKLVESMPRRCQAIIDNAGDWTCY